jgi:CUG-BP- and ETR3-like factor
MPRGFTVSYACIPTSVTPAEVAAAFERFGMVLQVVPFAHRREGPANSRGCGLVVMDTEHAAMAAVEALSGNFTWPGAERALLVQPFYGAERMAPHTLPTLPDVQGPGPQQAGQFGRGGGGMRGPTNHNSAASAGPRGYAGRMYQQHQQQQQWPGGKQGPHGSPISLDAGDMAPPGCAPDAFKLVLTNLPGSYSQSDIMSLLQPYGTVVSLTPASRRAGPRQRSSCVVCSCSTGGGSTVGS